MLHISRPLVFVILYLHNRAISVPTAGHLPRIFHSFITSAQYNHLFVRTLSGSNEQSQPKHHIVTSKDKKLGLLLLGVVGRWLLAPSASFPLDNESISMHLRQVIVWG